MAVMLIVDIPNMDSATYRKVHERVMSPGQPEGMVSHCCHAKGTGVSIIDIWESKSALDGFMKSRLIPALKELEVHDEPEVIRMTDLLSANAFDYQMGAVPA